MAINKEMFFLVASTERQKDFVLDFAEDKEDALNLVRQFQAQDFKIDIRKGKVELGEVVESFELGALEVPDEAKARFLKFKEQGGSIEPRWLE